MISMTSPQTPGDPSTKTAGPLTLTVFTGASTGSNPDRQQQVRQLGTELGREGLGIAYGGGSRGLMGTIADSVLDAGGHVHGVIPEALVETEQAHAGLTQLEIVLDMHQRKARMAALGDAFLALPGGMGTAEEFFEIWTWQYLGLHSKPVGLYNVGGFWDPMLAMVDHMVEEGFMAPWRRESLVVAESPADVIAQMRRAVGASRA